MSRAPTARQIMASSVDDMFSGQAAAGGGVSGPTPTTTAEPAAPVPVNPFDGRSCNPPPSASSYSATLITQATTNNKAVNPCGLAAPPSVAGDPFAS